MKIYGIVVVYFLAGLAQLAVWKDKVVLEIGIGPSVAVAVAYLLVLAMFGFLVARGVRAMGKLALQKQSRAIANQEHKNG